MSLLKAPATFASQDVERFRALVVPNALRGNHSCGTSYSLRLLTPKSFAVQSFPQSQRDFLSFQALVVIILLQSLVPVSSLQRKWPKVARVIVSCFRFLLLSIPIPFVNFSSFSIRFVLVLQHDRVCEIRQPTPPSHLILNLLFRQRKRQRLLYSGNAWDIKALFRCRYWHHTSYDKKYCISSYMQSSRTHVLLVSFNNMEHLDIYDANKFKA